MSEYGFGQGDASYQAAGKEEGITALVEHFYQIMENDPDARPLRALYPEDLTLAKQKLSCFLVGWLGGPKLYQQRFGTIHIPSFHTQWDIDEAQALRWFKCMQQAIEQQNYSQAFCSYLLGQLQVPAHRILQACQNTQHLRDQS